KVTQIWLHFRGLVPAYVIILSATYAALAASGLPLATIWDQYGLYPFLTMPQAGETLAGTLPMVLYLLGWIGAVAAIMLTSAAGSRITYRELKGDPFYGAPEARAHARQYWGSVLLSPLTLMAIVIFALMVAALFGLVSSIPFIGDLIFIGLLPVNLAGAIFTLLTLAVIGVLLTMSPAVTATWEDDATGTAFQVFAAVWNQPLRVLIHPVIGGALATLSLIISGWVVTFGYQLVVAVFSSRWLMGDELLALLSWAEKVAFSGYPALLTYIPSPSADGLAASLTGWSAFTGGLLALMLMAVYGIVMAYGLAVVSAGQTLSFIGIKWHMDHDNLLEREDSEDAVEGDAETGESGPADAAGA
ncbi:MAG: hypothetical protein IID15_00425, partial [Candidatus Marinimicrobia bacterium]|nr:hypothetical protein [Candidatus Neomarinimicrobiota bacterium]